MGNLGAGGIIASGIFLLLASVAAVGVLPAVWTAESILGEYDRHTVESLLLTPVERERIIWAKILARLRFSFWLALACGPAGLVVAVCLGWGESVLLWTMAGAGLGLLGPLAVMSRTDVDGAVVFLMISLCAAPLILKLYIFNFRMSLSNIRHSMERMDKLLLRDA